MDLYKERGDQVNWHQRRLVLFFGSEVLPKVELVARNHAIHGIEFIVWILHKSTIEHNVSTLMSVLGSPVLLLAGSAAVSYEITAQTSTHFRSHLATPYLPLYIKFKHMFHHNEYICIVYSTKTMTNHNTLYSVTQPLLTPEAQMTKSSCLFEALDLGWFVALCSHQNIYTFANCNIGVHRTKPTNCSYKHCEHRTHSTNGIRQ